MLSSIPEEPCRHWSHSTIQNLHANAYDSKVCQIFTFANPTQKTKACFAPFYP